MLTKRESAIACTAIGATWIVIVAAHALAHAMQGEPACSTLIIEQPRTVAPGV